MAKRTGLDVKSWVVCGVLAVTVSLAGLALASSSSSAVSTDAGEYPSVVLRSVVVEGAQWKVTLGRGPLGQCLHAEASSTEGVSYGSVGGCGGFRHPLDPTTPDVVALEGVLPVGGQLTAVTFGLVNCSCRVEITRAGGQVDRDDNPVGGTFLITHPGALGSADLRVIDR